MNFQKQVSAFLLLAVLAGPAHAEVTSSPPAVVFPINSVFFCTVQEWRSAAVTDRASWNMDVNSATWGWRPFSFTFKFGSSFDQGEVFLVEWQDESRSELSREQVLAHVDLGNGLENIMFFGVLGQGMLTATISAAGAEHPVRMSWTDLSGSFYYDAFMYCQRTGVYTAPAGN